jgi:hypothetical protein
MLHHFKAPITGLLVIFGFLGLLASQDPLVQTNPDGEVAKKELREIAAGCQNIETWDTPGFDETASVELPRINPVDATPPGLENLSSLIYSGNIVIVYDAELDQIEYGELESSALQALTEMQTPLYMFPNQSEEWGSRGNYAMYGYGYKQECVTPDALVFDTFSKYDVQDDSVQ